MGLLGRLWRGGWCLVGGLVVAHLALVAAMVVAFKEEVIRGGGFGRLLEGE